MKLRRVIGGMLLSLVLLRAVPAQAEGPLDLVPESASVILRLKSPEQTIVKVGNYVNAGIPGVGFLIQGQAPALGVLISNPTLGGVDLKQDWYVATFMQKNAQPQVVFVIPTTDDKALTEAKARMAAASPTNGTASTVAPAKAPTAPVCLDCGKVIAVAVTEKAGEGGPL